MDQTPFECVLDARAELGECPVWIAEDRALWWIDIHAGRLNRFDPATRANRVHEVGEAIGSFAPRAAGGLVAGLRSGFWMLDAQGRRERRVAAPLEGKPHLRMNDGRCDHRGRFWAGAIDESQQHGDAALYRLDADLRCEPQLDGLTISNGLAWSPDGRTLYHTDTPTRVVHAYDFDAERGTLSRQRVFHRFEHPDEHPDGAAVDSEGFYWVALYGSAKIVRIAPTGERVAQYLVPACCPTMPAFGGADLRTLYVTTARQKRPADELARYPQSGGLFAMRVDVPGLPEPVFAG